MKKIYSPSLLSRDEPSHNAFRTVVLKLCVLCCCCAAVSYSRFSENSGNECRLALLIMRGNTWRRFSSVLDMHGKLKTSKASARRSYVFIAQQISQE